jgi:uncharacterized repeat protein (TIGR03803 family)
MQTKRLQASVAGIVRHSFSVLAAAVTIGGLALGAAPAPLTTFAVVYNFAGGADGGSPSDSGLTLTSTGSFYGTTYYGGANGYGTVYEMNTSGAIHVIHSFDETDGENPNAGVVLNSQGSLFGTTSYGGKYGYGVVFKVEAVSGFPFRVLHNFTGGSDGGVPTGGVAIDASGNIYGTAMMYGDGGACQGLGCGVLWEFSSAGTFSVLHTFLGAADGGEPYSGPTLSSTGILWGTTLVGGDTTACTNGCGIVYGYSIALQELDIVHEFQDYDGAYPYAGITEDSSGNFWGTTYGGGVGNCTDACGEIFKIASDGSFSVVYSFTGGTDGGAPISNVVLDTSGNIYGTTLEGGGTGCGGQGCGVVYGASIAAPIHVLHAFTGGADGGQPLAGLAVRGSLLYGTTSIGGSGGAGVAFRVAE